MALLRGELDWVVMKCLEKQRDRRYETANGLARDIQRYLADEPVEARPPQRGLSPGQVPQAAQGAGGRGEPGAAGACSAASSGTTFGMIRAEQSSAAEAKRAEGERAASRAGWKGRSRRKPSGSGQGGQGRDKAIAAEAQIERRSTSS